MKTILYSQDALVDLRKFRSRAKRLMAKVERYAATGAGDVTALVGRSGKRLRDGDFRILFDESEARIIVTRVGPRGDVYDSE
jgi:mRNA interferase RelE/StbE